MIEDQQRDLSREDDILNSFDMEKFLHILRKSWVYVVLFFITAFSVAYLGFIRWSKPLYESKSILKLDFESEAKNLGLVGNTAALDMSELSGEIELLRSNLFLSRVAEVVNMDVSYYYYGNVLEDERYGNSPFVVSHKVKDQSFYDRRFDLVVKDQNSFELIYTLRGENSRIDHKFGEEIKTEAFNLLIEKTEFMDASSKGRYYFTINSEQAQVSYFQENVQVRPENFNAKTILISLQDHNANKARDLIVAIDTLYLEYTKTAKNQAIEQKISFLVEQIDETESRLEEFESYFESFTIENKTTNLQSDISKTILQLDALDSQNFNLKTKLSDADLLRKQLESENPIMLSQSLMLKLPEEVSSAVEEYVQLQKERNQKLGSYSESTFVIKRLNMEMNQLKADLIAAVSEYQDNLQTRMNQLEARKASLEGNFLSLPSMGTEYNKKRRFYQLQEEFLLSLRKSKMELEITRAGTVTNYVILSPASLPSSPIKPEKLLIFGVALSASLVFAFVFLLLRYLLNNKITSLSQLERLVSVPILGALPKYRKEKIPLTRMVIKPGSKSGLSESLRSLRTNMEFLNGTKDNHILTITSTVSGEGKTFVAVNLGAIMAFSNQKVCVVDMDMRKPKVHLAFGDGPSSDGVSTCLISKSKLEDCIKNTPIKNLDYLPAGPNPPNPSELIMTQTYKDMLKALSERYDIVILDTPPVGLVTDAVMSMKNSDLQLYVVRSDYSKRSFIKSIENLKKTNQFSNLSVIFNSLNNPGSSYGYGYGYGYGYYDDSQKS
ncbi:MAG: polysaccharide biosynthesis tyrosine autokinase [Cyclobacteriaceae bacterium]